jgi:hypothetical protein
MRGVLSWSLMCDLVPLDLEQQTAIANLKQPGGLTAVPACVPEPAGCLRSRHESSEFAMAAARGPAVPALQLGIA